MKKFENIYRELKHYSAFNANPGTPSEAIRSLNCFFAEIKDDYIFENDCSEKSFDFLLMSYKHTASQFIIHWQTDNRSFKQFLKSVYTNLVKVTEDEVAVS